jgi:hypothetical protein
MKLIPRQRSPIRSARSRPDDPEVPEPQDERSTPVAMHKSGGMINDEREPDGVVLGLGSRFRVPSFAADRGATRAGPAALPYRLLSEPGTLAERLLGMPLLRLEVDLATRGQAYRVLEPSSSRFRMRSREDQPAEPDPRFQLAGRGGPKVMLSDEDDEG